VSTNAYDNNNANAGISLNYSIQLITFEMLGTWLLIIYLSSTKISNEHWAGDERCFSSRASPFALAVALYGPL